MILQAGEDVRVVWADTLDLLSSQYYRVLIARSAEEARAALADAHVDLVIAEGGGGGEGLDLLSDLRISHPDIIRLLVLDPKFGLAPQALSAASRHEPGAEALVPSSYPAFAGKGVRPLQSSGS